MLLQGYPAAYHKLQWSHNMCEIHLFLTMTGHDPYYIARNQLGCNLMINNTNRDGFQLLTPQFVMKPQLC